MQQDCSALVFPKGKSAKAHLQMIKATHMVRIYVIRHISNDQATCSRPHIEVETMLEQQDCSALVFPKGRSAKAHLQMIKVTHRVKTMHMQPIQAARQYGNP